MPPEAQQELVRALRAFETAATDFPGSQDGLRTA
jgi:hypothetical protein